jgi:hypothetical protein
MCSVYVRGVGVGGHRCVRMSVCVMWVGGYPGVDWCGLVGVRS